MAASRKSIIEEFISEEVTTEESTNDDCCTADLEAQIAECAYYKAEKRGFAPGYEMEDWYAAEQEILANQSDAA